MAKIISITEFKKCIQVHEKYQVNEDRWLTNIQKWVDSRTNCDPLNKESEILKMQVRSRAANLIGLLGEKLSLTTETVLTAIQHTQRYFVYHNEQEDIDAYIVGAAAVLCASKTTRRPISMQVIIDILWGFVGAWSTSVDVEEEHKKFVESTRASISLAENILLGTIGFDVDVILPHFYIAQKEWENIGVSKDIAKRAYMYATKSFFVTSLCLYYRAKTIANLCIYLACKDLNSKDIPRAASGIPYYMFLESETFKSEREFNNFIENCDEFAKQLKTQDNKSPDELLPCTRFYQYIRPKVVKTVGLKKHDSKENVDPLQPHSKKPRFDSAELSEQTGCDKKLQFSTTRDPRLVKKVLSDNSFDILKEVPTKQKIFELSTAPVFGDLYF